MKQFFGLAAAAMVLSGCNALSPDPTNSRFATPSSTGNLSRVSSGRSGSEFSALTGNGYAYQVGSVRDKGLQGFAGIVPGATVSAPPVSGSVTMNGRFEVGLIDFILTNGTRVSGQSVIDSGAIALTADFDNGRLTGGGTGVTAGIPSIYLNNNVLEIDGTMNGRTLTGTATYKGVSGPLIGQVGGNEAIGAFHGHTDNRLHAGGFIAN